MLFYRGVKGNNKFPYEVSEPSQRHEKSLAVFVRPLVSRLKIVLSSMLILDTFTRLRVLRSSEYEIHCEKLVTNSPTIVLALEVSPTLCRQSSTYFDRPFVRGHCSQNPFTTRDWFILSRTVANAAGTTP